MPYLIRYPAGVTGAVPVVVFSHGLGGSRRGAVYYAEHLASHGYVVVMVQHPGSDASIWRTIRPDLTSMTGKRKAPADMRRGLLQAVRLR